jgi:hypothetical protein
MMGYITKIGHSRRCRLSDPRARDLSDTKLQRALVRTCAFVWGGGLSALSTKEDKLCVGSSVRLRQQFTDSLHVSLQPGKLASPEIDDEPEEMRMTVNLSCDSCSTADCKDF